MLYTSIFTQQTTNVLVLIALLGADAIENLYFLWKLNKLGKMYQKNGGETARSGVAVILRGRDANPLFTLPLSHSAAPEF